MAAFEVETGTGSPTANSYLSESDADDILDQDPFRDKWRCLSAATKQVLLRFATRYLDSKYRWFAKPFKTAQALGWPRTTSEDRNGNLITPGTIPAQLQEAAARIALEGAKAADVQTGVEDLTAAIESSGEIRSFTIETLSIAFDTGVGGGSSGTFQSLDRQFTGKRFPEIELLLLSLGELRGVSDTAEALQR